MAWLTDNNALVVGGGAGIGRGVVDAFVEEGAQVCVLDIDGEQINEFSERDRISGVQGDATNTADIKKAVRVTCEFAGTFDILVVTVGIWDYMVSIEDLPEARLDRAFSELFETNVKSYLSSIKAALPSLKESKGNIVLTVSNAGFYPGGGGPLYTASKFAVRGLVVELAHELAPTVRVNGVAPGGTVTDISGLESLDQEDMSIDDIEGLSESIASNPLKIESMPADHAWAYVYLAADSRARNVTGEIIPTDGGLSASKP